MGCCARPESHRASSGGDDVADGDEDFDGDGVDNEDEDDQGEQYGLPDDNDSDEDGRNEDENDFGDNRVWHATMLGS